ncbi:hypothetical protein FLL45_19430 [Aliikangiella marina]|uniref:DUF4129 domain-containing protein n=1 Tax=Aliikangiella marina TaxID=1712262 RepID=A0A545T5C2_9GAMM|nr:hypothetical protein [Aliikangiella marina]TQV72385.1 hypothetical protein FLL45_19430 [Aliikangiella marina]
MDLEKMTAKVRPRKGWEAIDLGVALVQQHAISLYKIWFLITLPFFVVVAILLFDYAVWAYVAFWLLKPFWERPLLHFLSRELFGERLSVKECVKSFFQLAKIQWFPSITWRRLSFTRSLDLPIIQLEGLSGGQRSQRLKVIHSIGSGSAVWLTIFFVFLELVFYFAILALAFLLLPTQFSESLDFWNWVAADSEEPWAAMVLNFVYYCGVSIVAPFFTACGFALYINQRTHLEAWDIELSFKRLAKRLNEQGEPPLVRLASIVCAVGLSVMLLMNQPVNAYESTEQQNELSSEQQVVQAEIDQDKSVPEDETVDSYSIDNLDHASANRLIDEIMDSEDFNETLEDFRFERRFDSDEEKSLENSSSQFSTWGLLFAKFISFIVEFALWVVVAVVIIFLITRYRHLVTGLSPNLKNKKSRPKQLFGLDMSSEELPDQPWQVAKSMIQAKQYREAMSLLYRASLIWYMDNTDVVIREGDTELECLKKLKTFGNQFSGDYFSRLTQNWRRLAYAHQLPDSNVLTELCDQWPDAYVKPMGLNQDEEQTNE